MYREKLKSLFLLEICGGSFSCGNNLVVLRWKKPLPKAMFLRLLVRQGLLQIYLYVVYLEQVRCSDFVLVSGCGALCSLFSFANELLPGPPFTSSFGNVHNARNTKNP